MSFNFIYCHYHYSWDKVSDTTVINIYIYIYYSCIVVFHCHGPQNNLNLQDADIIHMINKVLPMSNVVMNDDSFCFSFFLFLGFA